MSDVFTPEKRSEVMGRIRGKDTKPEMKVRSYLHGLGFRFRLHKKGLPGRPDIWLAKYNAAIFVNGCFWHRHKGCRFAYTPRKDREFWQDKFAGNVARDRRNLADLKALGYRTLVVWECALMTEEARRRNLPRIDKWLLSGRSGGEIP